MYLNTSITKTPFKLYHTAEKLPRTQTSLFKRARKGRREGDNGRDVWQILFSRWRQEQWRTNMQFLKKFSAVHFANFEQIIAYPRRVYEEEAVFTSHIGLKHHNVYYRTT